MPGKPSYPSSFTPFRRPFAAKTAKGAADFLREHDKVSMLLPTATRIAALQKDCAMLLPSMAEACAVMQLETGQLTLSVPNAALAAKIKQQLPKLQDALNKRGWHINAIRLKVKMAQSVEKPTQPKQLSLPPNAVSAFASLDGLLDESVRNQTLKAAIRAMVQRHRAEKK